MTPEVRATSIVMNSRSLRNEHEEHKDLLIGSIARTIAAAVAAEREATGELIIKIMNEETDGQKRNDEWAAGFKLACRMIGADIRARGNQ